MSERRARRLILVAIAISLLLHVAIATFIRWPYRPAHDASERVTVEQRARALEVVTTPQRTPQPALAQVPHTPAPQAPAPQRLTPHVVPRPLGTPAPVAAIRAAAHAAKPSRNAGTVPSHAAGAAAQTPAPLSSVAAACARPDAEPMLASSPAPPDIPASVRGEATRGTAAIRLQLDASGTIASATVAQSTGNSSLDAVAVAMARDARYAPALRACKPVPGSYTFTVTFAPW
jgi:TonB family protein